MHVPSLPRALALLLSSLTLTGCLTSDTLIKVRADGSGTLEQTLLVNAAALEGMAGFLGGMAGGNPDDGRPPASKFPSPKDLLDEAKLKEAAATFGPGVRYVSSTPMKRGNLDGATAIFAFDDINTLNVSQSPGSASGPSRNPMVFKFERRPTGSVLTVTMKEPETATAPTRGESERPSTPQLPPEAMAFIKPMLQGLHIAVAIDVEGTLIKTSADHVSGNRVTLMDIDFGPLLENAAALEKLTTVKPGTSIEAMKPLLKDMPGMKVNTSPSISIEFK